jgi:hypothetical protein
LKTVSLGEYVNLRWRKEQQFVTISLHRMLLGYGWGGLDMWHAQGEIHTNILVGKIERKKWEICD